MKRLIVVTTRFPYFYTEAFLESEHLYLKENFDDVVFLPLIKGKVRESCNDSHICDDYNELYSCKWKSYFSVIKHFGFYHNLWEHKSKLMRRNIFLNIFKQQAHYYILRNVVNRNKNFFDGNTIVYSYWFNAPVYAFLKIREEQNLKYKVVCRAHRFDVYDDEGEMPNRTYCLRNIDKVFPISQDAINVLSSKYGFRDKFELCRLGVKDYGKIAKASETGKIHVLSVSQVHPRKRVKEIFDSLCVFAERHHDIDIVWSHFGDGPQLAEMESWVKQCVLKNLRIEIKGRVPNQNIMSYMGNTPIDVFMNLSSSEGVPVSVMEAQSFGIPVIATNVGGTSEVMNPENGVLLPSAPSTKEIIQALEKLLSTDFDRYSIKRHWNEISNAQVNFPVFVKHLQSVL